MIGGYTGKLLKVHLTEQSAIDSLAVGGSLVVVSVTPGATIEINAIWLMRSELVLTGSRYANRQEIRESLELVRRSIVKPVILQTFPLEEANEVNRLIDEMKLIGRTALIID